MRRAAVEGILNQLADDFRTRRKIPQVGRWSRHRLATARHFEILEHRNLSDNCSRSGGNDQIVRHSLIIRTNLAEDFRTHRKMPQVARWSRHRLNGKTLRNPRVSQPFGQLLSERRRRPDCQTLSSFIHAQKLASAPLLPPLYLRSSPFDSPSHLHRPVVVP